MNEGGAAGTPRDRVTPLAARMRPAALAAGLLCALLASRAGASVPARPAAMERDVVEVRPEFRWAGTAGALSLSGRFLNTESDAWTLEPAFTGLVRKSLSAGLNGTLSLDAGARRWPGLGQTGRARSIASIVAGASRRALWAGAGAARIRSGSRWSTSGVYEAGATVRFGRTRLSLLTQAASYSNAFTLLDTVFTPGDSLPPYVREHSGRERHSYADTGLGMMWQGERIGVGLDLNVRAGRRLSEPRATAVLNGSYRMTPRLTLVASGGRNPSIPDQGLPSHHFATMAFRLDLQNPAEKSYPLYGVIDEPVRPSFSLETLGDGRRRIRIRLPDAASVDLAGDFSDWQPLPLHRGALDTWDVVCTIPPGPHRTNIRVDGERWIVPPGLQALPDEFNGLVGVFVAP